MTESIFGEVPADPDRHDSVLLAIKHRIAAGAAVAVVLLYLWAELAAGIFTTWGS